MSSGSPKFGRMRQAVGSARRPALVCSVLVVLATTRAARSQDSFALERFHPAPAGDRFLGVPSPYVAGDFALHAALVADYGYRPLVLTAPPATASARVSHHAVLHADLTLSLSQRLLLNLDLPALAIQAGETTPALHAVDLGDVRLGARVRVLGENGTPLQLGLGGYFWLPTATGTTNGDDSVRGMPYVALGGLWRKLLWSSLLGAEFRPSQRYRGAVREGISLNFGGALGYLVDRQRRLQLGLESTLSFVVADPSSRNLNAELLLEGRYRFLDRFETGLGVGPGLSQGVGTSTLRVVAFLAYVPVADLFSPEHTLPPENPPAAADSLIDRSVRLPRLQAVPPDPRCCAVVPSGAARAADAHAMPAAKASGSADTAILFDAGSAEVDPRSERAIHALADYLILHPEIRKVELCGYADIHGTVASNERLGARRAEAVRRVLIRHSVAPERLVTKSYGATALAASSTTAEGMRHNRRVVIRIVEISPVARGAADAP
jgi:outer membrane protein OmpA-like peptidoglycan-associated protein